MENLKDKIQKQYTNEMAKPDKKKTIEQFENIIRENNLDFKEATSLFRWGRWKVFNDGIPANEPNPTQIDL